MAISVKYSIVDTDGGVPVGSDAGEVVDEGAAFTTVVVGGRSLAILLLLLLP